MQIGCMHSIRSSVLLRRGAGMAKRNPARKSFVNSVMEEIRDRRAAAMATERAARREVEKAQKAVKDCNRAIRDAERRINVLRNELGNYSSIDAAIAKLEAQITCLQARLEILQKKKAEMSSESKKSLLSALNEAELAPAKCRSALHKAEARLEDAQWRLAQAEAERQEVFMDTDAERRFWWDAWDAMAWEEDTEE